MNWLWPLLGWVVLGKPKVQHRLPSMTDATLDLSRDHFSPWKPWGPLFPRVLTFEAPLFPIGTPVCLKNLIGRMDFNGQCDVVVHSPATLVPGLKWRQEDYPGSEDNRWAL
jgi:hypothetical protein